MADTTYYPFRLTETVLTDSDFGFGSGVFGGWISDLENGVNGAVVVYKWTQAYHTDTVNPGESMKHEFDYSESIEVEDSTKQEFEAKQSEEIKVSDSTKQEFTSNPTDTVNPGESMKHEFDYSESIEVEDSTKQEFEAKPNESLGVWEYDQNYLDKANPTASGTSETKPTASGTSETKPRASGIGIKDVDD